MPLSWVLSQNLGMDAPRHLDSLAVHCGREGLAELGVHALPIDLSSTYPLPDVGSGGDSYEAMAAGGYPRPEGGAVYQRLWNRPSPGSNRRWPSCRQEGGPGGRVWCDVDAQPGEPSRWITLSAPEVLNWWDGAGFREA